MGMSMMGKPSPSTYDKAQPAASPPPPNPNPNNWQLFCCAQIGSDLVVWVRYPDCTNYEGHKIMLYRDTTLADLRRQKHLDPHFSKSKKFKSPFARFEPTCAGWNMAVALAAITGGIARFDPSCDQTQILAMLKKHRVKDPAFIQSLSL